MYLKYTFYIIEIFKITKLAIHGAFISCDLNVKDFVNWNENFVFF